MGKSKELIIKDDGLDPKEVDIKKDREIKDIQKKIPEWTEKASSLNIIDEETLQFSISLGKMVRDAKVIVEGKRKFFVKPFNDFVKGINDFVKKFSHPLDEIERLVRRAQISYQNILEEKKKKEDEKNKKKIERAIENDKPIPIIPQTIIQRTVKSESGTLTYKDNWIVSAITDRNAFIKYCYENNMFDVFDFNSTRMRELAKFIKDTRVIPGIIIKNEKITMNSY